jgi:cytoskeletal protein RodZ
MLPCEIVLVAKATNNKSRQKMSEQNQNSPYEYDAPKRGKKMKATGIAVLGVLAAGAVVGGSAWASTNTSPDPSSATSQVASISSISDVSSDEVADLTATAEADSTAPAIDPTVSVPVVSYSDDDEADDQGDTESDD